MRWTTEKKQAWIRTRLAFGPVYTHRIVRAKPVCFVLKTLAPANGLRAARTEDGIAYNTYGIAHYHLVVNSKGQIVNKPFILAERQSRNFNFCSIFKAVAFSRAYKVWGTFGLPNWPTIELQTRGILPPHVIDILFDRLRNPAV